MRLGLIGAGRWGKRYISTIVAMPEVRLSRLASGNPASKALVPEGCIVSPDWRGLVSATDLDGIIIATPPHTHTAIALAAIEAGIPVLIEKPLTLAPADAQRIAAAARNRKVLAVVDHTHLYSPAYRELKLRGAALGALKELRSCGANWGPFRPDTPVLWDYAPHDIAMCIDLAGHPPAGLDVFVEKQVTTEEGSGAAIQMRLHFPAQLEAHVRVSNVDQDKSRWLEAVYAGGTLRYDDLCEPKLAFAADDTIMPDAAAEGIPSATTPPLTVAVSEFCAKIASGAHSDPSLELGARIVDILAACDRQLNMPEPKAQAQRWN